MPSRGRHQPLPRHPANCNTMWIKVAAIVVLFQLFLGTGRVASAAVVARMGHDTFLYFAYGSNLLGKRIHIQNPTAVRYGTGRVKDYRLDFYQFADRWNGAPSTIVPDPGREVWGAIWEIKLEDLASLDSQEGVDKKVYRPMDITVETPHGSSETCRVYILCNNPDPRQPRLGTTAAPSETYIKVIIKGAIESGLPEDYIRALQSVEHNGRLAIPELVEIVNNQLNSSVGEKTTPRRSPLLSAGSVAEN